jgi:hypothetical protein
MALPAFNEQGDLPPNIYRATLSEVFERFGHGSLQRLAVAERLSRLYELVTSTGQLARFVVFGSFVTAKVEPNDLDVVLIMQDTFDLASVTGEAALAFQHLEAEGPFRCQRLLGSALWCSWRRAGDGRILAGTP